MKDCSSCKIFIHIQIYNLGRNHLHSQGLYFHFLVLLSLGKYYFDLFYLDDQVIVSSTDD